MKKPIILLFSFILFSIALTAQEVIEEAKVIFDLPEKWSLQQKAGTFEDGLVQYFYSREPVLTPEGTEAYPATIFILDKVNGRTLDDYVNQDVRMEKNGRMSAGTFEQIQDVMINDMQGKFVEIKIEDSGYRLRTSIYYFINNGVLVKLILNTIRDPNPAIAELEEILKSLKAQ